jgi:hypothetical protein
MSHGEKLHCLYCSPNIIRVMKSRRVGGAGNLSCLGEKKGVSSNYCSEKPKEKRLSGIPNTNQQSSECKDGQDIPHS